MFDVCTTMLDLTKLACCRIVILCPFPRCILYWSFIVCVCSKEGLSLSTLSLMNLQESVKDPRNDIRWDHISNLSILLMFTRTEEHYLHNDGGTTWTICDTVHGAVPNSWGIVAWFSYNRNHNTILDNHAHLLNVNFGLKVKETGTCTSQPLVYKCDLVRGSYRMHCSVAEYSAWLSGHGFAPFG